MKKIISGIISFCIIISCIVGANAQSINMCVKNHYVTRDLQILGSVDMIPILDIAGELGLKTYFDGYNLWIEDGYRSYKFTLGSADVYDSQGNWHGLDAMPKYANEKLYIPSTFLNNVLGISYSWDNITKTLYIGAEKTLNWVKTNQEYKVAVNCRTAYAQYLQSNTFIGEQLATFELGYLNNDDIPELFVAKGGSNYGVGVDIYTYKNGKMIFLGEVGSYGWVKYKEKTGTVYGYHSSMGYMIHLLYQLDGEFLNTVCQLIYEVGGNYCSVNDQEVSRAQYNNVYYKYGFDRIETEFMEVPNLYINSQNITNGIYNF